MKRMLILLLGLLFLSNVFAIPLDQIKTKADPGTVVLTFDDGPNPTYTPQIIDILKPEYLR